MGLVIADKAKYEIAIQPRVGGWLAGEPIRKRRLSRIVEVPLFVDSRASRAIQMADLVAHATWRSYEQSDGDLLDLLLPAFPRGETSGKLDSFMHLTGRHRTCDCYPCESRRERRPTTSDEIAALTSATAVGDYVQTELFAAKSIL